MDMARNADAILCRHIKGRRIATVEENLGASRVELRIALVSIMEGK